MYCVCCYCIPKNDIQFKYYTHLKDIYILIYECVLPTLTSCLDHVAPVKLYCGKTITRNIFYVTKLFDILL